MGLRAMLWNSGMDCMYYTIVEKLNLNIMAP